MSEFKAAVLSESEAQWRQFLSYLFAQGSTGIATSGVVAGLGVSQTATASGSVLVGLGHCVTQSALTTGVEPLTSNADKTLDVLGASPMGALPRYDLIVFNPATALVEAVIGTANASPSDPTPPAGSVRLARVRNAANATTIPTSAIDDLRVFTTLNVPVSKSQSITPVYTNTLGESLSVGDGSIVGRWRVSGLGSGQACTFQFKLTRGAGTNVGTGGNWAIQLPTPGVDFGVAVGAGLQIIGSARKQLGLEMVSSTLLVFNDLAGNRIGPTNPGGTAASQAGHVYQGSITYFLP